jgi:hypothetical protein
VHVELERHDGRVTPDVLRRYEVRFRSLNTGKDKWTHYNVLTWKGELKTVALAAMAHNSRHPRTGIYSVEVVECEPPSSGKPDVAVFNTDDLFDRMEW